MLSYNKHHAPSNQKIPESQVDNQQQLRVVKAINGIENSRFQPIIKVIQVRPSFMTVHQPPRSIHETLRSLERRHKTDALERERYIQQSLTTALAAEAP